MARNFRSGQSSLFEEIMNHRHVHLTGRGQFRVIAGPGEALPELVHGDLLLRQTPYKDRPQVSRIQSAPATPDDLFIEGVMAERGPSGLYVEIAGRGSSPIARRISDPYGRVAEKTLVLRPGSFSSGSGAESFGEETNAELQKRRDALLASITSADLYWHVVPLAEGHRIRVSSPIMKDDLFIPATAAESLKLARQFDVFPLTRAVADQAHNFATKVDKQKSPASLFDFVTYSKRLRETPYYTQFGYSLTSGAHKLWVISARGAAINYGFYIKRAKGEMVRCGRYLDTQYNVIQSLGARHNSKHWDYSQLLQFMTGLEDASGQRLDLRRALQDRLPAVWDEAQPPHAGGLP